MSLSIMYSASSRRVCCGPQGGGGGGAIELMWGGWAEGPHPNNTMLDPSQLQHQKTHAFSPTTRVSIPISLRSSRRPQFQDLAPHPSHPTVSTGTHLPSVSTGHPHHQTLKNCTTAGSHTHLCLPIAPYLSQRSIIPAPSMTGFRCGAYICALPPARLPPPRVRRRRLHQSLTSAVTPDSACVTHPRNCYRITSHLACGGRGEPMGCKGFV